MSRPNGYFQTREPIKEWCSTRIIPFIIKDNDISILLGLDSKYKEYTPFGGKCDLKPTTSCSRQNTDVLKQCLSRELSEESKELINLDKTVDFVNCNYIHYITRLQFGNYHNNVYFAKWESDDNIDKILKKFKDQTYEQKLIDRLKNKGIQDTRVYFEMSDIAFIPINKVFGDMIYNTIQNIHESKKQLQKNVSSYRNLEFFLGELMYSYPYELNYRKKEGSSFDPNFLVGLIEGLMKHWNLKYKYKKIDHIIKDLYDYIKSINTCSIKGINDDEDN